MSEHPYSDLLHRPHHVSRRHPPMSRQSRAAQFSPFAALTGYDALVEESARVTDRRIELSEDELDALNARLLYLRDHPDAVVTVVYFAPDARKDGGEYAQYHGTLRKIRTAEGVLVTETGAEIPISDVLSVEGECFRAST